MRHPVDIIIYALSIFSFRKVKLHACVELRGYEEGAAMTSTSLQILRPQTSLN